MINLRKWTIHSSIEELKELEASLIDWLRDCNVNENSEFQLFICIHEYILNIIKHGYKYNSDGNIDIILSLKHENDQRKAIITIKDKSPKFNIENLLNERLIFENSVGLNMISNMTDSLKYSYEDNFNILNMHKII